LRNCEPRRLGFELLDPPTQRADVLRVKVPNGGPLKVVTLLARLDQENLRFWTQDRDWQTRNPSPGPEVDDGIDPWKLLGKRE